MSSSGSWVTCRGPEVGRIRQKAELTADVRQWVDEC